MISVNLVYECQLCGEREHVGPYEIAEPSLPIIRPIPDEQFVTPTIWHQCYKKAGLDIDMWGICKFIGIRGIDAENKKENAETVMQEPSCKLKQPEKE
jgi:hypothetical protein